MKKKTILIFSFALSLAVFFSPKSFSQNLPALPSAESAGLIRSIQNPVDYSTGIPQVQVPLYNIESYGIQVPVTLNYHAAGIKVEDRPGIAGMGWRLSAGGKITRVVKGYPDDNRPPKWGLDPSTVCTQLFQNVSDSYYNYNGLDTEPDVFFFEIPGRSGMFVFTADKKAITIPYQNISITWHAIGVPDAIEGYFVIKDEQGTEYTFGTDALSWEYTTSAYTNGNWKGNQYTGTDAEHVRYISTWHLDKIKSYTGNTVNFNYIEGEPQEIESVVDICNVEVGRTTQTQKETKTNDNRQQISTRFLNTITWEGGKLEFQKKTFSSPYSEVLGSISLYSGGKTTPDKTTQFSYTTSVNKRTFLKDIKESFRDNSQALVASFSYYDNVLLPASDSKDYDSWGYYNGKGNTTDFPTYLFVNGTTPPYKCADRTPDLNCTRAQTLRYVNYPTGGKTEYVYELNKDQYGNNIGGLRIKEIKQIQNSKTVSSVKYEYNSAEVYQKPEYLFGYNDAYSVSSKPLHSLYDITGRHVSYKSVKEILPDGRWKVYSYDTGPDTYQAHVVKWSRNSQSMYITDESDIDVDPGRGTNNRDTTINIDGYNYITYKYHISPGAYRKDENTRIYSYAEDNKHGWYQRFYFEDPSQWTLCKFPTTSHFWRRNLLNTVETFNSTGVRDSKITHEYELGLPYRDSVRGHIPYVNTFLGTTRWTGVYKWESQPIYLKKTIDSSRYAPTVTTEYTYDTERMVPTSVKVTDGENNQVITKTKYASDYSVGTVSSTHPLYWLYLLQKNNLNPAIETVTERNGKIVSGQLQEFKVNTIGGQSVVLPYKNYALPLQAPLATTSFTSSAVNSGNLVKDSRYKALGQYDEYNSKGLLLKSDNLLGQTSRVFYDQYGQVVAQVSGSKAYSSFYTGFEDVEGTAFAKAKTGRKAKLGAYTISLSSFADGAYELSYWKSTDAGTSWERVTETVNKTSSVNSRTIGNSSTYLDEVRIHAKGDRMTTCSYLLGFGKESETDYLGNTVYYTFNAKGQPYRTFDNEGNLREEYLYNTVESTPGQAPTISGSATPRANQNTVYTMNSQSSYADGQYVWSVSNGTIVSQTNNQCTVRFSSEGAASISCYLVSGGVTVSDVATQNVTVWPSATTLPTTHPVLKGDDTIEEGVETGIFYLDWDIPNVTDYNIEWDFGGILNNYVFDNGKHANVSSVSSSYMLDDNTYTISVTIKGKANGYSRTVTKRVQVTESQSGTKFLRFQLCNSQNRDMEFSLSMTSQSNSQHGPGASGIIPADSRVFACVVAPLADEYRIYATYRYDNDCRGYIKYDFTFSGGDAYFTADFDYGRWITGSNYNSCWEYLCCEEWNAAGNNLIDAIYYYRSDGWPSRPFFEWHESTYSWIH